LGGKGTVIYNGGHWCNEQHFAGNGQEVTACVVLVLKNRLVVGLSVTAWSFIANLSLAVMRDGDELQCVQWLTLMYVVDVVALQLTTRV